MVLCEVTLVERELDLPGACRWWYLCGRVYVVYGPTAGCCRFAQPYSLHRYCLPFSRFAVIPAGLIQVILAAPHFAFIAAGHTLVFLAGPTLQRHSRAGGNPVLPRSPVCIPACAGMTRVGRSWWCDGWPGRAELLLGHGFGRISHLVRWLQLGLGRYAK